MRGVYKDFSVHAWSLLLCRSLSLLVEQVLFFVRKIQGNGYNFAHPRVNQTKQHAKLLVRFSPLGGFQMKSPEVEDRCSSSGLVIWKPPKNKTSRGGAVLSINLKISKLRVL